MAGILAEALVKLWEVMALIKLWEVMALIKLWEVMALIKLWEVMRSDQSERLRSARQSEVRGGDIQGGSLGMKELEVMMGGRLQQQHKRS